MSKYANEYYHANRDKILARNRVWKKKNRQLHNEQIKKSEREYHNKNPTKTYTYKIKVAVISHYSENVTCINCGFGDIRALSIDHINGGGTKERTAKKLGGTQFYTFLKKSNFPKGYQVLCMNCQFIKRYTHKELNKFKDDLNG